MTTMEIPTPDPRTFDETTRPFAEAISAHFSMKREIGRGGMGVVFLARDRRLDRLVAIKTLPPQLSADPDLRERFLRETRTAGGMAHPNIVPIHGADEIGGHVYFVMSFIDGESLAARLRSSGRIEPRTAARYLRDVASALAHAHQRGIIHRDIKAENILIERATDRALVTDFGIARLAEATPLTITGQVLGTVHYVSPEQVSGDTVDARSDIYSLGVVGFMALTGRFPFNADVASAVLVAHVTKPAPPVNAINAEVPAALSAIVDRCLAKDPARRYASADDLLAALDGYLASPPGKEAQPTERKIVISEKEAQAVWKRAAELQALTGIQPRPTAIPRPRDVSKDRTRGDGFIVDEVRVAAAEAGITDTYVEHALIEHGLMKPTAVAPWDKPLRSVGVSKAAKPAGTVALAGEPESLRSHATPLEKRSFWAGTPLHIVREIEIAGEIPARDVERLINVLRDATGRIGTTGAKTRELSWWTGGIGNRLDVTVVPDRGRTEIRIVRSICRHAYATMLLSLATLGVFGGIIVGAIVMEMTGAEEFGVMVGLGAGIFMPIKAGRWAIGRLRKRAVDRLQVMGERLASKVRDSIAQLTPGARQP